MFIKCLLLLFVFGFIEAEYSFRLSCMIPRIAHGRARQKHRAFIKFTCSPGYTLVGHKYTTCRYGQWDEPIPVCARSGCPALPEVSNAVNITSHNGAWIVFFCVHGHELVGSPSIYCDGTKWNATAPGCYDSTSLAATGCDFEQPDMCGWKPDDLHDFDWRRWTKKTPSSFLQTGPSYDHTYGRNGTGHYMYIESTGPVENATARLLSPVYDGELAKNGCFVFFYHMFGRSMGGLRVYQKPDRVSMYQLLRPELREDYTLFEKWGDQGNEWYTGVSMLSDFSDDFQIVIEGIRGDSFMSDIAIDDVSIQQGENCTKAKREAILPPSVILESCVGRCDQLGNETGFRGCSCNNMCVIDQNCCPDYMDVCDNDSGIYYASEDDSFASINVTGLPPQTQKLIATTTETLPTTTSTTFTTSTSTSTSTTSRKPVQTRRPFTTTTTTTKAPTTSRIIKPTAPRRTTTTKSSTTTSSTTKSSTTTSSTTTTSTTKTTTTTPRSTTKVAPPTVARNSTTLVIDVKPMTSTTIRLVRTTQDKAGNINTEKEKHDKVVAEKTGGMSGTTVGVTVLLVCVAFAGATWVLYVMSRSSRGVAALARIRGRTTSDPEVHYVLKSDVDEFDE